VHRRVPRFHIDFARPPLLPSKGQQILSHSFLFPAFQESALSQQADKESKLFQVFRFTDSRQSFDVQIYFDATLKRGRKKCHERAWRARACSRDASCAYPLLLQAMVIFMCPLQILMHSLATMDSNNPLVFCPLGCDYATPKTKDRVNSL